MTYDSCLLSHRSAVVPLFVASSIGCLLQSTPDHGVSVEAVTSLPGRDSYRSVASADAAPAAASDTLSAVGPAQRPTSLQSRKHEVAAYTADLLAGGSGQEVSFEEVRAAKWFAEHAKSVQVIIRLA